LEEASEGGDATSQSEEADGLGESSDDSSDSNDSDCSQDSEGFFNTDEDDEGDDTDEDDEDEESTDDGDNLDAVDAEEDAIRCRLCTDLDAPPSCVLGMKSIVECRMCLEAVPKAVYVFHLMKFHAKAPYLDEAPALFANFLPPGCHLEAFEEPNYNKYTCPELKGMIIELGFERRSVNRLKKAELIETLEAYDRGECDIDAQM